MLSKLLILIFLFIGVNTFSQEKTNLNCPNIDFYTKKAHPWYGNNQFLDDYLKNFPLLDSGHVYFYVPLSFHVFLNPRENIEILNRDIKTAVKNLNIIYKKNNTGIQFYLADQLFYREKKHLKSGYVFESFFVGKKDFNKDALNIYFVNILELNLLVKKIFYRGMYSSLTNSIMIIRHSSNTTLAHEIGHSFGLLHPHRNWKKGKSRQECVSRTRKRNGKLICEINGDCLYDTPAEPDLRYYTNKNCDYTGVLTDDWGDYYCPNTNNIMSYPSNSKCRTSFTNMQRAVMLYTISSEKNHLNWNNCLKNILFYSDAYEPDNVMSMASKISFNQRQYHTFNFYYNYKGKLMLNNIDWLSFKITDKQTIKILFEKARYNFPDLTIFILDSKNKCLLNRDLNSSREINLQIEKGEYFIKIESKSPPNSEPLDYFISLKKVSN